VSFLNIMHEESFGLLLWPYMHHFHVFIAPELTVPEGLSKIIIWWNQMWTIQ